MDSENYINGRLADAHDHFTVTFNSDSLDNVKPGRAFFDRGHFVGILLSTHDSAPADQWLPNAPIPVCISGVVAVQVSESVQVGNKAYADSDGKIGIADTGTKLNAIFLENGNANDIVPLLIYGGAA